MDEPHGSRALRYLYKLIFYCTNNEAKYEAMILEILDLKKLQVNRVVLCGDSELVIKQMTSEYQARHPQMRSYRNSTQDLIEGFKECIFKLIPIVQNCVVDSLATSASTFNFPTHPIGKYEIEVRNKNFVLDSVKRWKVFKDDKQIYQFLTLVGEFEGATVDEENKFQEEISPTQDPFENQMVDLKEVIQ